MVTALREELAPLLARSRVDGTVRAGRGRFYRLRLGTLAVFAGWTGDGARCAAEGLQDLLSRLPVDALLLAGVAGGLSPELEPGALVIAREVRDAGGAAPPPDPGWVERALDAVPATAGTLLTARRIAATAERKVELRRRLGGAAPAAVDLETAAWARAAAAHGVPYLAVRAVSDTAAETLPLDFERWRDRRGRVRRGGVALHALLHPGVIGALLGLRRRVRLCAERLADAALDLLVCSPRRAPERGRETTPLEAASTRGAEP